MHYQTTTPIRRRSSLNLAFAFAPTRRPGDEGVSGQKKFKWTFSLTTVPLSDANLRSVAPSIPRIGFQRSSRAVGSRNWSVSPGGVQWPWQLSDPPFSLAEASGESSF
jgi:hypothetical protein